MEDLIGQMNSKYLNSQPYDMSSWSVLSYLNFELSLNLPVVTGICDSSYLQHDFITV